MRKTRPSVLKRQREVAKRERKAAKAEKRAQKPDSESEGKGPSIASEVVQEIEIKEEQPASSDQSS